MSVTVQLRSLCPDPRAQALGAGLSLGPPSRESGVVGWVLPEAVPDVLGIATQPGPPRCLSLGLVQAAGIRKCVRAGQTLIPWGRRSVANWCRTQRPEVLGDFPGSHGCNRTWVLGGLWRNLITREPHSEASRPGARLPAVLDLGRPQSYAFWGKSSVSLPGRKMTASWCLVPIRDPHGAPGLDCAGS